MTLSKRIDAKDPTDISHLDDEQKDELITILRQNAAEDAKHNFAAYCRYVDLPEVPFNSTPATHHILMQEKLQLVADGEINNLMILMPPGGAKSTYGSVGFPTWYLGRFPGKRIIGASHAGDLAEFFGSKCRGVVDSEEYGEVFNLQLATDTKAKTEWNIVTKNRKYHSGYYAVGVDGSVTGRRADGFIGDDLVKGRKDADSATVRNATWEWYKSDMRTRLKPHAFKILIMTRWHEDDPAGRILPEDYEGESGWIKAKDGEMWYVLSLQAECEREDDPLGRKIGEPMWPEWWPEGFFEQEKISQGPRNWAALYQQRPAPEDGDFFQREWIQFYDTEPKDLVKYGASDYAVSEKHGDWTVHGVMGINRNDDIYLLDWWRDQRSTDIWIESLLALNKTHKVMEWAEEAGQILKAVGPFINKRQQETKTYFYRKQYPSAADKMTRAQSFRGRLAQGKVYFPRHAHWVEPLINEMMRFTGAKGNVDDQVDVLSLFGRMLDRTRKPKKEEKKDKEMNFTIGGRQNCTYDQAFGNITTLRGSDDGDGYHRVRN